MLKKILIIVPVFILVFVIFLLFRLPLAEYLDKTVNDFNNSNDVKIVWSDSENKPLKVIISDLKLVSQQGVILSVDKFVVTTNLFNSVKFKGTSKDGLDISGTLKDNNIKFKIKQYRLPSYIESMIGEGSFDFENGNYNFKEKKGSVEFVGSLKNIPTPIIKVPASLSGTASVDGNDTDISFEAMGSGISGNGKINIKDKQVSGNAVLKAGVIPVSIKLSGDLNNIKIKL